MDGALSRVPPNFFENVWYILERTPGGLRLCNIFLPQVKSPLILTFIHTFSFLATDPIGYDRLRIEFLIKNRRYAQSNR